MTAFFAPFAAAEILPPEKQQAQFRLPPGFEIQLVAADPEIGQPMNLNFDVRGRLWVTHSVEYPYPAKGEGVEPRPARFGTPGEHPPRDRLTVMEGIGADGKAAKITHFAQGLNIPIGVTPIGDGTAALAFSIPAIYRFADTTGDGKADRQQQLYARFGNVDTHGMSNSYTRWIDGWIYGCHGFSNRSEIADAAGRVTKLNSGNTYRFKESGSHFQQFTWGQVNPFGLTFDPLGNLYSADCHSRPIYLLLRGALYPHFGNQPDGLGFGPTMIRHDHGSTGICGPAYYAADHFPEDFRDNVFICNPVTGRINRDKLQAFGSTYECVKQPDFVSSEGDLFRPVDCIVGPDGALYVADFCNPIIGHYEAPLDHPQRDRTHGRIWRIVWRGEDGRAPPPQPMPDLTKLSTMELLTLLGDTNLAVRTLATNYLVDFPRKDAALPLRRMIEVGDNDAAFRAHGLWVLERLGQCDDALLEKLSGDRDRLVRVHLMRLLAERQAWSPLHARLALSGLADDDAFVRRAAADALGQHPAASFVADLLSQWEKTPPEDTHLVHTIRLALRTHLRDEGIVTELAKQEFADGAARRLVEIAAASDSEVPTPLFLAHARPGAAPPEVFHRAAAQIARRGTADQLQQLLQRSPQWFAGDDHQQFQILAAVVDGLRQKGVSAGEQSGVQQAVRRIAPGMMADLLAAAPQWTAHPVPGLPESKSPWGVRHRGSTDGDPHALFWDSIAGGEQLTGILRSQAFPLPERLSFWMCGHNGHPSASPPPVNHIRLVHAETGAVLAREFPPRHDTARQYTWKFDCRLGEQAYIEIVDAHRETGFAWIAAGRFEPPVVRVPAADDQERALRLVELVGLCGLAEMTEEMASLAGDRRHGAELRSAALASLQQLGGGKRLLEPLAKVVGDGDESDQLRGRAAAMLGAMDNAQARKALREALAASPAALQRAVALAMTQTPAGAAALVETVAAGRASPRLLLDPQIAQQLAARASAPAKEQIAELTQNLPPPDEQAAGLIERHRGSFAAGEPSPPRGAELFKKHCAACHRIGEEGGVVGPQLDGVGHRGLARLLEDILDPNRNVDIAFRTVIVETVDGRLISGLERRREGEIVVLADQQGKEIRIPAGEIEARRQSDLSLMPANYGEILKDDEVRDLVAWLLAQRQSP